MQPGAANGSSASNTMTRVQCFKHYDYASIRQDSPKPETDKAAARSCLCPIFKKRYLTALMCHLGLVITFGFRCNVGVATGYFRQQYNGTLTMNGTTEPSIKWSASIIGAVDSSYFWGYLVSQIPGGIISNKFAAARVFSIASLSSSVLHLFLPMAFRASFELSIAIRVLQGLFEGFLFPACHGIWSQWAPPQERSLLVTLTYSGCYIGTFYGLLLSGVATQLLGWPAPFYIYGSAGVLWFCAWLACVFEKPSVHPCITDEEREYIQLSIGENLEVDDIIWKTPWAKIFTSAPVYAIIVSNFARNWSTFLLMTEPTKYFSDVFGYNLSQGGLFSALPHLALSITVPVSGYVADELRKKLFTTVAVRKLYNTIGFVVLGVFLLGVGYTNSAGAAILCLTVGVTLGGISISGFNVNHLDIAPRYASLLMGLSNGIGSISGILVPVVTVQLVKDRKQASWSKVFLITSLISFISAIFYAIFASGERQEWAETPVDKELSKPQETASSPTKRRLSVVHDSN